MPDFSASFSATLVRTLLAVLLLAVRLPVAAQAPAWQSARAVAVATAAATDNSSVVTVTAVDVLGNVFLAGTFTNTVMLGGNTLTSIGSNDVFVAKFSPTTNQFVWAQRAGGTGNDYATALALSGTSVYVAGSFTGPTVDLGAVTLTNTGNTGSSDVFVGKLTDAGSIGNFVWAQQTGGNGNDRVSALSVSGANVYVAGYFTGSTMVFGPTIMTNAANGFADIFVGKLTDVGSTGYFVWAQRVGGTGGDGASALAVSGTTVYVAGEFGSSTVSFGPTTLTNVDPYGSSDIFVAKLIDTGSTGSFVWAQWAGGTDYDQPSVLAVRGTTVYVAGNYMSSTAGFGSTILTNVGATDYSDIFVAKLTDAGNTGSFVWAQRAGGIYDDFINALALNGTGVYVAGRFNSTIANFGATTLASAGANGNSDVFVAKLTDAGNTGSFTWAQRAGGIYDDFASTLALNETSIYVAGSCRSLMPAFGTLTLSNPNATYLGFLASLADPTLTATTTALPREPAQLYPNPTRHMAILRLPAGTTPAPLTLTDALGRAVRRYPAPAIPETILDLRGLPAGLYLLRGAGPAQRLMVE